MKKRQENIIHFSNYLTTLKHKMYLFTFFHLFLQLIKTNETVELPNINNDFQCDILIFLFHTIP